MDIYSIPFLKFPHRGNRTAAFTNSRKADKYIMIYAKPNHKKRMPVYMLNRRFLTSCLKKMGKLKRVKVLERQKDFAIINANLTVSVTRIAMQFLMMEVQLGQDDNEEKRRSELLCRHLKYILWFFRRKKERL